MCSNIIWKTKSKKALFLQLWLSLLFRKFIVLLNGGCPVFILQFPERSNSFWSYYLLLEFQLLYYFRFLLFKASLEVENALWPNLEQPSCQNSLISGFLGMSLELSFELFPLAFSTIFVSTSTITKLLFFLRVSGVCLMPGALNDTAYIVLKLCVIPMIISNFVSWCFLNLYNTFLKIHSRLSIYRSGKIRCGILHLKLIIKLKKELFSWTCVCMDGHPVYSLLLDLGFAMFSFLPFLGCSFKHSLFLHSISSLFIIVFSCFYYFQSLFLSHAATSSQ